MAKGAPEMDVRSARVRRFSAKSNPSFAVLVGAPGLLGEELLPLRGSRRALAPKLMRRAKGVAGMLDDTLEDMEAGPPEGSSSKGDSSTEPEFALDTLSARALIVVYGDV